MGELELTYPGSNLPVIQRREETLRFAVSLALELLLVPTTEEPVSLLART